MEINYLKPLGHWNVVANSVISVSDVKDAMIPLHCSDLTCEELGLLVRLIHRCEQSKLPLSKRSIGDLCPIDRFKGVDLKSVFEALELKEYIRMYAIDDNATFNGYCWIVFDHPVPDSHLEHSRRVQEEDYEEEGD